VSTGASMMRNAGGAGLSGRHDGLSGKNINHNPLRVNDHTKLNIVS